MSTWRLHNPTWTIRLLDLAALATPSLNITGRLTRYANMPRRISPQYSDLLRTELLYAFGGLWIDATILCLAPIESWLARGGTVPPFFALRYPLADNKEAYKMPRQIASFLLFAASPGHLIPRH